LKSSGQQHANPPLQLSSAPTIVIGHVQNCPDGRILCAAHSRSHCIAWFKRRGWCSRHL